MSLVLVADDDADILELVAMTIERAGHEVVTARDGEQALELARTARPDVAVLDVSMPKLDGLAATEQLRADAATRGIRVVLLTARAQASDAEAGAAAGADDYVTKPFSPSALVRRIEALLAGTPAVPPA